MKQKRKLFEVVKDDRNERKKEVFRRKNREGNMTVRQKKSSIDQRDGE